MVTPDHIKQLIEQALPHAEAHVEGDDGTHFAAVVVCPEFEGKGTLAQHRLVYQALGKRMGGEIHALSLKTLTPAQRAAQK